LAPDLPTFAWVQDAARHLDGRAVVTPLLECPELSARLGGRILVKAEMLQRTGSFKFRGAWNRIGRLSLAERAHGVVAWSSGNHAQGVAAAAALAGCKATIVMPKDAPAAKIARTRDLGATIVLYDRYRESREAIGQGLADAQGAVIVPPYDDPYIIAGQGTIGLEIDRQAQGSAIDAVLVPCSGGGLSSGIALALSEVRPQTRVWVAEPNGFDDTHRSLAAGRVVENSGDQKTICDALMAPRPGERPFALLSRFQAGAACASDSEVRQAMRFAFEHLKLVVEPGGAVALAALLAGRIETKGKTIVAVLSGGNVDAALYREAIAAEPGLTPSPS